MSRSTSGRCAAALAIAVVTMAALVPAQGTVVPRPAPAFTLERLDGQMLSLSRYRGSAVILLFWAPW